ncbi:MAG: hypothetical protein C4537_03505 [Acholeplasma sp.]|nr:MAG: hypothetical protein C4537_03505 [Acholeplasma sp.]
MIKKIIIIILILGSVGIYFLVNQPASLDVDDLYQPTQIQTIMESPFIDSTRNVTGSDIIAENNFLKLFMNDNNTHFAVVDKRNDYVWQSNFFTSDPGATKTYQNLQKSTFAIRYRETDDTTQLLTNYEYSIQNKQFEIDLESVDQGFRVTYTVADRTPKGYWFPTKIAKERFLELVYNPFMAYEFESPAYFTELDRYLRNAYKPMEDDPNTYILALVTGDNTSSNLVGTDVSYLFEIFYEIGHYGNKKDDLGDYIEEYQLEDVLYDNEMYGYVVEIKDPEFVIPMEVKLTEDSLVVEIITEEIMSKEPYDIVSIQLLPYLGAANETKDGYIVVPEGSGGLIHFNNGKIKQRSYSSYIYDKDHTLIPAQLTLEDEGANLPIYGLKHDNNAMLAIIEGGAEHALITAEVSKKNDRFNKVIPEFTLKDSGLYYLTQAGISIWHDESYDYHPLIRYYFTAEEKADYNGLAEVYGNYLTMKYQLETLSNQPLSLYLDILGSYDFDDYFLFFPYKNVETLTTYHQAKAIIESLKDSGVEHFVVNYMGWFNRGMHHERPNHIDLDQALGSKKDLAMFSSFMQDEGFPLYMDVDFVKLYDKKATYSNANIARIVGGTLMEYYPYDITSRMPITTKDPYYLLKLAAIEDNINGFLDDYDKYSLQGIALRSLSQELYSDFHRNSDLYRYEAIDYVMDLMAVIAEKANTMMIDPNQYVLPFADHIIDLPYRSSNYLVLDEDIPFYQLAIAGKISYAMPSINLNQDQIDQYYLLKAIETGSQLKFTISYEDTSQLINTDYNTYFSTEFALIEDKMIDMYQELLDVIGNDNYLISHDIIGPDLILVTYANGQSITIDYQSLTYTLN